MAYWNDDDSSYTLYKDYYVTIIYIINYQLLDLEFFTSYNKWSLARQKTEFIQAVP